jgi:hypothetical protein
MLHELLCCRSHMCVQSFVSISRTYSVSIDNIFVWACHMYYTIRTMETDYDLLLGRVIRGRWR